MSKTMENKQYNKNKSKYSSFFYKNKHGSMKSGQHYNENGSGGYSSNVNNGGSSFSGCNNSSNYMYKKRYNNYGGSYNAMKHNAGGSYNHEEMYNNERKVMNGGSGGGVHSGHGSRAPYKYNNGPSGNSNMNSLYCASSFAFKKRGEQKQLNAKSHSGNKDLLVAEDGPEERKTSRETGDIEKPDCDGKNRTTAPKEDSSKVPVTSTAASGISVETMKEGSGNNKNRKDLNEDVDGGSQNKSKGNNIKEENTSADVSQRDRRQFYDTKENTGLDSNSNVPLDRMDKDDGSPFCDSKEQCHERTHDGRQQECVYGSNSNSSSGENDNELSKYGQPTKDARGQHMDRYTDTENEGALSTTGPMNVGNDVNAVGDKKMVDINAQANLPGSISMDMMKNNGAREVDHEYDEDKVVEEERVRERDRISAPNASKEEGSYMSQFNVDPCERGAPREYYYGESSEPQPYYGCHVEKDLNALPGKDMEKGVRGNGRSKGKEVDQSYCEEYVSRSEGKCNTRVKREAKTEIAKECDVYISGENSRKRLKKFQRMHKIGKVKENRNGDNIFNILISTEVNNNTSEDNSELANCYEGNDVEESNEPTNNKCTSYGIGYMFIFHYYYILHKNKSLMHNFYAENAALIISANSINLKFLKHNLFKEKLGIPQDNVINGAMGNVPFANVEKLYTEGIQVNDNMLKLNSKELIDGYYSTLDVLHCTVHILSLEVVDLNEDLLLYVYGKIKRNKSGDKKYHSFVQNILLQKYNTCQYYVKLDFIHYYDSQTDDGFFVSAEEMKKMDAFQREQLLKSISQKKSEILRMKRQLNRPFVGGSLPIKKTSQKTGSTKIKRKTSGNVKKEKKEGDSVENKTKGSKLKPKKDTSAQETSVGADAKIKKKNKIKIKKKVNPATKETVSGGVPDEMTNKAASGEEKHKVVKETVDQKVEVKTVVEANVKAAEVPEEAVQTKNIPAPVSEEKIGDNANIANDINKEEASKESIANVEKKELSEEEEGEKKNETEGKKKRKKKKSGKAWNKNETKNEIPKFEDIIKEESIAKGKQKKKKKEMTVDPNSWVFRVMKNSNVAEEKGETVEPSKKDAHIDKEKKEEGTKDKKNHNNSNSNTVGTNNAKSATTTNNNINKMNKGVKAGINEVQETTDVDSEMEARKKEKVISANEKKIIIHNVHKNMDKKKINDCIIERLKSYNDGHAVQIDIYERSAKKYLNAPYIYQYNYNTTSTQKIGSGTSGNVHVSNSTDTRHNSEKINGVTNNNTSPMHPNSYEKINIADYCYAIAELDCRQSQQLLLDLGLYCNGIRLNIEQFKDKKKENPKYGKRFSKYGGYSNGNSNNISNNNGNNNDNGVNNNNNNNSNTGNNSINNNNKSSNNNESSNNNNNNNKNNSINNDNKSSNNNENSNNKSSNNNTVNRSNINNSSSVNNDNSANNGYNTGSKVGSLNNKRKEEKPKGHFYRSKGDSAMSSVPIHLQVGMNSFRVRRGKERGF